MSSTVIEYETLDQLGVHISPMLHLHNFHHVQVDGFSYGLFILCVQRRRRRSNHEDGVYDIFGELLGELVM